MVELGSASVTWRDSRPGFRPHQTTVEPGPEHGTGSLGTAGKRG